MSRAASSADRQQVSPLAREFWAYVDRSQLPLTMGIFLLPIIILYELGTRWYACDWVRHTETRVLAFNMMRNFLELFGATGRYLPCLTVVGILLAWHIIRRDKWQIQLGTAATMGVESALLAIPILATSTLMGYYMPLYATDQNWMSGIVIALGAGVYEELVFRLMALTLLNMLLIDLLRIQKMPAYVLMVLGSAVLFAAYHYWSPRSLQPEVFCWRDFVFRTASGVYFAFLFIGRGFGVTAGCHTAYDLYYFTLRAIA